MCESGSQSQNAKTHTSVGKSKLKTLLGKGNEQSVIFAHFVELRKSLWLE